MSKLDKVGAPWFVSDGARNEIKFPVIFVGNFCAGQGKNTEILRVCSNLGCVKIA